MSIGWCSSRYPSKIELSSITTTIMVSENCRYQESNQKQFYIIALSKHLYIIYGNVGYSCHKI